MPHKRVIVVFATTSGSTRMVAEAIAACLKPERDVVLINLAAPIKSGAIETGDMLLFGTPTYGRGDCHYLWKDDAAAALLAEAHCASLFCLGDSRSHSETFGGGLVALADVVRAAGVGVLPQPASLAEACAPGKVMTDGIILDFKRDRHGMRRAAEAWARSLCLEHALV